MLILALVGAIALRVRYGGGEPYPDLSTTPQIAAARLEVVVSYPEPIGNVAVSAHDRVFFTVHPEARPTGNKLLEWVEGAAVPYPSGAVQPHLFDTPLGVIADQQNRLWTIDHGNHGFASARVLAFDIESGKVAHDHTFGKEIAPAGSMLQDLAITPDGKTIFIADASLWRKSPAIVVYDIASRTARRVLESHESVNAQNFLIRTPEREMSFVGGLVAMKVGVDGIVVDESGRWLYYGAMNHSGLYRAPLDKLANAALPSRELENLVERYSDKPLSDGLAIDTAGNIYVADVEHGAVALVDLQRNVATLLRSPEIRWADSLAFGPDGSLYIADSALAEQILQTAEHIAAQGPYYVFRVAPVADTQY